MNWYLDMFNFFMHDVAALERSIPAFALAIRNVAFSKVAAFTS